MFAGASTVKDIRFVKERRDKSRGPESKGFTAPRFIIPHLPPSHLSVGLRRAYQRTAEMIPGNYIIEMDILNF